MELVTKYSSASASDGVKGKPFLWADSHEDFVSSFVDLYAESFSHEVDQCLTSILNSHFGVSMARPIKYLLDHVDEATRKRFAYTYLDPEGLGFRATATVVVRGAAQEERISRNRGRFLISIRTADGCEHPVKFTNQISAVYYLMYLIDRYQKQFSQLAHIKLGNNQAAFVALYHAVYDNITHEEVLRRFQSMLYCEVNGRMSSGREHLIIYDIRRTLSRIFENQEESFLPYAMTAHSHLALRYNNIEFDLPASQLLYFQFN